MRWSSLRSILFIGAVSFLALILPGGSGEAAAGDITTVAGGGVGDGGPAVDAFFRSFNGVDVDAAGNIYIADRLDCRIRRIDTAGTITTVAGIGACGLGGEGDGGPATSASLTPPWDIALDAAGNLFIAEGVRIRRVDTGGIITTIAGGGVNFPGDGGPATDASLGEATGVDVDAAGNVYIGNFTHCPIRRVDTSGIITTVAGSGAFGTGCGFGGDGGPASAALLGHGPRGVAVDAAGNLYIADTRNSRIRRVDTSGIITTVAGAGFCPFGGDGGPATSACLNRPFGVAVDAAGKLYIADTRNCRIRRVDTTGIIDTVAGSFACTFGGDGGPASSAFLRFPASVAIDSAGNIFISGGCRLRRVDTGAIITTVAGRGVCGFGGDGGPATSAMLGQAEGVAVDDLGNIYIADGPNCRVRGVDTSGVITTVAGDGVCGFAGDGGPATSARLSSPQDVAVDAVGNLYIADFGNCRVRRVDTSGIISTVAGSGLCFSLVGDGGPATSAGLERPIAVTIDTAGNLYIVELTSCQVRRVDSTGIIDTVAGGGRICEFSSGDGGPATSALLRRPFEVAVDGIGNVYISESSRVRRIDPAGIITTVGGGGAGCTEPCPATDAVLSGPGIAVDPAGNIYVGGGGQIKRIDPTGILTTVAGSQCGFGGDGGPATAALLSCAAGRIEFDSLGNLYIADHRRIRRIESIGLQEVQIDIKPGSDPNSISTKTRRPSTIPVAILSAPDFDAPSEVDNASLTFGRTGDEESLVFCTRSAEDVDGDGLLDQVCHFNTQDTGFQCGDTEGILRGQTVDGVPIEGSDSVRIVPCR